MITMKHLSFFLMMLLVLSKTSAQPRSVEQSAQIVYDFVLKNEIRASQERLKCVNAASSKMKRILGTRRDDQPFYVWVDSLTSSFLIVSGDERMKDILGYGDKGAWNDTLPDALLDLMETYRQQYDLLQNGEIQPIVTSSAISIPDVAPILQTTWEQGAPYNDLCPKGCPSGCVATAMSQVMKFYGYPVTGYHSFSYTSATKKYKCSFDFASAKFDWESLQNSYPAMQFGPSATGREEVAQITYACGVSVGMDYDTEGSGAYMSDVPYALIHFFGYNKNVSYCYRPYYQPEDWYQILCNELSEGRPVLYGGVDSKKGGHAFVIDGCNSKTGKFHVNWGWGGSYDGEYELDALNPTGYKFSTYQSMVINVFPQEVGNQQDVFYADQFTVSGNIEIGKTVTFTLSDVTCFSNQSSYAVSDAKFYGTIGVGIFDNDFRFIASMGSDSVDGLNNFYGYEKVTYNVKMVKTMFPENGTYYLAPYVQSTSAETPTMIKTLGGRTDYIAITINGDEIDEDDDCEDLTETDIIWEENFESAVIPAKWSQEKEVGKGEWKARSVLLPSVQRPSAASGRGYAYLDYTSDLSDIFSSRTTTKLVTNTISLPSDTEYTLFLQCRKYTTNPEPTDILSIYYSKAGEEEWVLLTDISVTNQSEWVKTVLVLPNLGDVRLAFVGSLSRNASLFLDDIKIFKKREQMSAIGKVPPIDRGTNAGIYTLSGVKVTHEMATRNAGIYIQNGKKIYVR